MERVRTGFTTIFNELQKEYYDNDFFSGFMEWEDLASISETFTLLNLLQKIPVYWYKINYLAAIYREKEMDDEGRVLFQKWEDEYFRRDVLDYIENVCAKQQKREENSDYEKFLSLIFGFMEEDRESYYPESQSLVKKGKFSLEKFCENVKQEYKKLMDLFEFAVTVNMSVEDFEEFLKRGLQRSGFNYYDPNEAIIYCVLTYGEPGTKMKSFIELQKYYLGLKKEETGERYRYTLEIKEKIDDSLDNGRGFCLFRNPLNPSSETITGEMADILQGLKNSEPSERSIIEIYKELKEKAIFMNGKEILAYDQKTDSLVNYAKGKLQVTYDGKEVVIPKNTVFYFWEEIGKKNERERYRVEFQTVSDTILPKTGKETVAKVEVVSCSPESTFDKNGEKIVVQSNTAFSQIEGKEIPGILGINTGKQRIKAVEEEQKLMFLKTDDSKLFRYLYGEARDFDDDGTIGKMMFSSDSEGDVTGQITKTLLESWFMDTKFKAAALRTRNEKASREIYITRSEILTMAFLAFVGEEPLDRKAFDKVLNNEKEKYQYADTLPYFRKSYEKRHNNEEPGKREIYDYFTHQVNDILEECGMQLFSLANPYDCLLAYLLLCDEPITVLRQLWRIALQ